MRRLQGRNGNHAPGNFDTRDTTRGNSEIIMPSIHSDEPREILYPVTCGVCGLQYDLCTVQGVIGYCDNWHLKLGTMLEKVSPQDNQGATK
jgi:hypothetical protein